MEKNDTFEHTMANILACRAEIYGLCALWIIVFHISNRIPVPLNPLLITPLIHMGNLCVDVFLFLSGYCLCLSWEKNPSVRLFYKRRILRILPPYFILSTLFYAWKYAFGFSASEAGFDWLNFFGDVFMINFWRNGMQTTWFVCAIFVFYAFFPLLYKLCKIHVAIAIMLLLTVYAINIFCKLTVPCIYDNFSIALCRLPVFIFGIALCVNRKTIDAIPHFYTFARMIFLLLFFLFAICFPSRELCFKYFNRWRSMAVWMSYITLVPGLLILAAGMLRRLPEKLRSVLVYTGGGTLELYMIHVFILRLSDFYYPISKIGWTAYIAVPAASFMLYMVYDRSKRMLKKVVSGEKTN